MGIVKTIKKYFKGEENALPGVEFHQPQKGERNEEIKNWIFELYTDAFQNIENLKPEWQQNRRAFMGETKDHYAGWGTVADTQGQQAQLCTNMVADKIGDLVAMQIQSKPTVYPLPNVKSEVEMADLNGQPVVPGWLPDNPEGMSQMAYVQKWVEAVFNDIRRYQKEASTNIKMSLDGRLCRIAISKQYPVYDAKTGQYNIKREIIQPEDFAADPSASNWDDINYEFQKTHKTFFEAISLYPDFKDEIRSALKSETTKDESESRGTEKEMRSYKGLVTLVEGYFKDSTVEKVENPDYAPEVDPMTGLAIEDEVNKYIEVPKYPEGRRITFLVDKGADSKVPGAAVVLKDEPNPLFWNPFSYFVPDPVSWSIYGRNQASPIRAIQVAADNTIQQAQANIRACANNHVYYVEDAIDEENLKNAVGAHIPCTNLDGVREITAKPILGDISNFYMILQELANIESGVNATSEGQASGSVSSGKAFAVLSENTNRKVKPSKDCFAETLEDIWRKNALYALEIYEKGRFLVTSDEDRLPVRLPFTLRDFVDAIDVQVDNDSHFPSDPISKFNMLMTLAQTKDGDGFPFADRDSVLKETKFPGASDMVRRIKRKFDAMTAMQNAQNAMGSAGAMASRAGTGASEPAPAGGLEMGGMVE